MKKREKKKNSNCQWHSPVTNVPFDRGNFPHFSLLSLCHHTPTRHYRFSRKEEEGKPGLSKRENNGDAGEDEPEKPLRKASAPEFNLIEKNYIQDD